MRPVQERYARFISEHPDPSDALAHTLSVYAERPDEELVITATTNIYGQGVRTGLTWGDLRKLAEK